MLVPLHAPESSQSQQTKHIALRHHFIQEKIEDNTISLGYVLSAENLADLLTEPVVGDIATGLYQTLGYWQHCHEWKCRNDW